MIRETVRGLGFSGLRWAVVAAETEETTCIHVTAWLVMWAGGTFKMDAKSHVMTYLLLYQTVSLKKVNIQR